MSDEEYLAKLRADILQCVKESVGANFLSPAKFVRLKVLNRLFVTRARKAGLSVSEVVEGIPEIVSVRCEKTNGLRYALKSDLEGKNLMAQAHIFGNNDTAARYAKYYKYIEVTHDPKEFAALADWLSCMEGLVDPSPEGAAKWLEEWRASQ